MILQCQFDFLGRNSERRRRDSNESVSYVLTDCAADLTDLLTVRWHTPYVRANIPDALTL